MKRSDRDRLWEIGHRLSREQKNSPLASAAHILAQKDKWYLDKLFQWDDADKKQKEAEAAKKEIVEEMQAALNWLHTVEK